MPFGMRVQSLNMSSLEISQGAPIATHLRRRLQLAWATKPRRTTTSRAPSVLYFSAKEPPSVSTSIGWIQANRPNRTRAWFQKQGRARSSVRQQRSRLRSSSIQEPCFLDRRIEWRKRPENRSSRIHRGLGRGTNHGRRFQSVLGQLKRLTSRGDGKPCWPPHRASGVHLRRTSAHSLSSAYRKVRLASMGGFGPTCPRLPIPPPGAR